MGIILGGASASDLILDGHSVSLYVGGNPPTKVWPTRETVQITLGNLFQARDQLRAALSDRGLNYRTVTEIPFDIELVGTGSVQRMFEFCSKLTSVPDMDTSSVTDVRYMFYDCSALTDGNVRLIGKHPNVSTTGMITGSGLTREPWYTADGRPIDVYEVSQSRAWGDGRVYTLVTLTVPAGETWQVRIQGTVTETSSTSTYWPNFRIGTADSGRYGQNAAVDFSGTITAANSTIAMVTNSGTNSSFVGTVTIEI